MTQYDREKYRSALGAVMRTFHGLPAVDPTFIVIDNKREGDWVHQVSGNLVHIGGENRAFEFSAFDKGLAYLRQAGQPADVFVFATDALLAYGSDFLDLIDGNVIDVVTGLNACVGWMDSFGQECEIGNCTYGAWIRTSLVFVPPALLPSLEPFAANLDDLRLFDDATGTPFGNQARISSNLQQLLLGWLTTNQGSGTQLGETWHSRFALNPETTAFFRAKVSAILREHLLSGKLQSAGIPCYDFRAVRRLAESGVFDDFMRDGGSESWQWLAWAKAKLPVPHARDRPTIELMPDRSANQARPDQDAAADPKAEPAAVVTSESDSHRPATLLLQANLYRHRARDAVSFFVAQVLPLILQRDSTAQCVILADEAVELPLELDSTVGASVHRASDIASLAISDCVALVIPGSMDDVDPTRLRTTPVELPIIANSTVLASEWTTGRDLLAADSATEFAEACCSILQGQRPSDLPYHRRPSRILSVCDRPIFVLGAPRSGTSMMQFALRQHPNLWGGQESDFLIPLLRSLRDVWEFGRRRGRLHWISGQSVGWREFLRHVGVGINSLYTNRAAGKRWVEQTPQYTLHLDDMTFLFPGAQFLVMVRDGRQVVESLMRFVNPVGFEEACRLWATFNAAAMEFARGPSGNSLHFVSYERAVADTKTELVSLFEFIGEPFAQASVDHIVQKAPINSSFKGETGTAKLTARWRSWPTERRERFHELAGAVLIELGYERDQSWIHDDAHRDAA